MNIDKDDRAPKMDAINIPTAPAWLTRGRGRITAVRSAFDGGIDLASIMIGVMALGVCAAVITSIVFAVVVQHNLR